MRRAEWLQEKRLNEIRRAYTGWTERRMSQKEAVDLLGVSSRTFRRYVDRYEEAGLWVWPWIKMRTSCSRIRTSTAIWLTSMITVGFCRFFPLTPKSGIHLSGGILFTAPYPRSADCLIHGLP